MQGGAWGARSAAISSARGITSDMEALRAYFDSNGAAGNREAGWKADQIRRGAV